MTGPENAAREAALAAADAYRRRFGEPIGTWEFLGRPRELERELRAAVRRGELVKAECLYRRLGMAVRRCGLCLPTGPVWTLPAALIAKPNWNLTTCSAQAESTG